MTYVLDSSAIIKAMKYPEQAEKIEKLIGTNPLITTSICKHELLSVKNDKEKFIIKKILDSIQILDHTTEAAEQGAEIYRALRKKGETINEFDLLIAGICKANNAHLITYDKDFAKIKEIKTTIL